MTRRNMIRGSILLIVVAVVYFAPEPEGDVVVPTARTSSASLASDQQREAAATGSLGAAPEILAIRPRLFGDQESGPFEQVAWEAPVPPPSLAQVEEAPPPPPPPQAPPLPFKVLGQYSESGEVGVFLLHNDKTLVARVGDTLAEQYKVESLTGEVMTLLYVPLQQQQTLVISAPH
jgi:hypothetical protein